jgi:hypothetical protein
LLAVGSLKKVVRVYHTDALYAETADDLVALARVRVKRDLTTDECKRFLHVSTCPARP